jgi:hypothetical protein
VDSADDVNQLTASKMVGIDVSVRKWISSHLLSGMQDKIKIWSSTMHCFEHVATIRY